MPIQQISITDNEEKIYYHEPNRRIRTIDLNTLAGSSLQDSNLELLIKLTKGLTGNFDTATNTYLGFRIANYTTTTINTLTGNLISNDGINDGVYYLPPLNLVPNQSAWWGFYELELIQTTGDLQGLDFFDGTVGSYTNSPTRKIFRINVYENFNNTPNYPTLTPGRIKWIEYKRSGASPADSLVFVNNLITQNQPSIFGFKTGDPKYSMVLGDNVDWVTANGQVLPNNFVDLIAFLRSVTINTVPINFTSIDSASGLVRLTIPNSINLKNVRFGTDPRYSCVTILSSTGSITPVPNGVYRIQNIVGNQITLGLSYSANYAGASGTFDLSPYANEDDAGGGARTPFPDFIRGVNPIANPNDILRQANTYQDGQVENHNHPNTITSTGSLTGSATGTVSGTTGGSGLQILRISATPVNGGDQIVAGNTGGGNTTAAQLQVAAYNAPNGDEANLYTPDHSHSISGTVSLNTGSLGVAVSTSLTLDPYGGQDTDNPNKTRPDNLGLYVLIKT